MVGHLCLANRQYRSIHALGLLTATQWCAILIPSFCVRKLKKIYIGASLILEPVVSDRSLCSLVFFGRRLANLKFKRCVSLFGNNIIVIVSNRHNGSLCLNCLLACLLASLIIPYLKKIKSLPPSR